VTGICSVTGDGGSASGNGVEGRTLATANDTAGVKGTGRTGVIGIGATGVSGRTTGANGIAIEGDVGTNAGAWAGVFRGSVQVNGNLFVSANLFVSGTKSAVVQHPDGSSRTLFALESPRELVRGLREG
jgi:hypothetical protein